MKDRIELIMSVKNLTPTELAEKLNVQRSSISHILSERNKPSLEFMLKITDAFPDLSLEWVFKGEGAMMKNQITSSKHLACKSSSLEKMPIDLFEDDDTVPKPSSFIIDDDSKPAIEPDIVTTEANAAFKLVKDTGNTRDDKQETESQIFQPKTLSHSVSAEQLVDKLVHNDKDNNVDEKLMPPKTLEKKKVIAWVAIYNDNTFKMYDLYAEG